MAEEKSWEEMGISREELFTPQALEYWKQIPIKPFLGELFYEGLQQVEGLKAYLQFLAEHVDLEAIKLPGDKNAKWVNEILLEATNHLEGIFKLISYYRIYIDNE